MSWNYLKRSAISDIGENWVKIYCYPFHSSVHVRFLVDKTALGQIFLEVIQFCPDSIIRPMLHTHLRIITFLDQTDNGEKPGENPYNSVFFPTSGNAEQKVFSHNFIGVSSSP